MNEEDLVLMFQPLVNENQGPFNRPVSRNTWKLLVSERSIFNGKHRGEEEEVEMSG